jgi:cell wall-associated NlpC family hydrolase
MKSKLISHAKKQPFLIGLCLLLCLILAPIGSYADTTQENQTSTNEETTIETEAETENETVAETETKAVAETTPEPEETTTAAITKSPSVKSTSLTVTTVNTSKLKLQWKAIKNVTGYKIYRSTSKEGTYKIIQTLKAGSLKKTVYTDSNLKAGKTYYYKIRCYITSGKTTSYSAYSTIKKGTTLLLEQPAISVKYKNSSSLTIKWKTISNATGYKLYRSTKKDSGFKSVSTVKVKKGTKTYSYTDTGLKTGTRYYYKLRAYKTVKGKKKYSDYSKVKSGIVRPDTPTISYVYAGSLSATIHWSANATVDGYQILRASSKNGTYKKVKTITNNYTTAYTQKKLTKGKSYYYKLRSYITVNGKKVYSNLSKAKSLAVRVYNNPEGYLQLQDTITLTGDVPNLVSGSMGLKVAKVQRALGLGYRWEIMDSSTISAVRSFQLRKGLPVTGVVNRATWVAMGFSSSSWDTLDRYVTPVKTTRNSTRSDCIETMISTAMTYLGTEYVVGAAGTPGTGVDCSGLVMQCMYSAGLNPYPVSVLRHQLPGYEYESRNLYALSTMKHVSYAERQRGDLIFYQNANGVIIHVAIYLGNDQVIESWPDKVVIWPIKNSHRSLIKGVVRPFV